MPLLASNCLKGSRQHLLLCLLSCFAGSPILYAQLQAEFRPDKQGGCSPLTVSFTNATRGASAGAVYLWDFGNGNTSALQNPGVVYTDERAYPVTLTVKDGGRTSVSKIDITVYKKPVADFSAVSAKVCLPAAASFTSGSLAGDGFISQYHWDFGNGVTQSTGSSQISYNYESVQQATVSLTVTNSYGCHNSITKAAIVEILPEMRPGFTITNNILCDEADVAGFVNTSSGPGPLTYVWNFGDGTTSSVKDPSHVYNKRGLFQVQLEIGNPAGCKASISKGPINVRNFETNFSNNLLCREANFTGTSFLTPDASLWSFGDNTASGAISFVKHVYAAEGSYVVKRINTYGVCKDSVSKTIVVKDKVDYGSTITMPTAVCRGGVVSFDAFSTIPPGSRVWDFGDNTFNNGSQNPFHSYFTAGSYTVKLTNTFGTCTEVVTKVLTVNQLPDIKDFTVINNNLCGAPATINFKDNTPGAVGWDWNFDFFGSRPSSALKEPSHTYSSDDVYLVSLVVRNAAGCFNSTAKNVVVRRPSAQIFEIGRNYPGGVQNCDNLTIQFGSNSTEPITDYLWSFGDGGTSTQMSPVYTYTKEGNFTVQLSYTTVNGCKGSVTYTGIRVYKKPKADFDYFVPPCSANYEVHFFDKSSPAANWEWLLGPGQTRYGSSLIHLYSDTGKYQVRLITIDGGCRDTIMKDIRTTVLPSFISITSVSKQTCEGERGIFKFDQSSLRASGNSWDFGDGVKIPYDTANHNVTHTYTNSGSYIVTLTATSGACPLVSSIRVTVLLKQRPVLTFDAQTFCSNQSVGATISGLVTNPYTDGSPIDYQYYQYRLLKFEYEGGGDFNGSVNSFFSYNSYNGSLSGIKTGDVRIRAIVQNPYNGCTDTTNYVSLKVNGPSAKFDIVANDICWKSPFTFRDLSTTVTSTPIRSWLWEFGDGQRLNSGTGNTVNHTYNAPGNYTTTLTVVDAGGCSSSFSLPGGTHARG
ncbi:MAG: PKD domain-containing protein, partial [Chitinophagaceae bacterium]|nr:PKD domain-containing protein [Chitinophagaceae bacterium]